MPSVKQSESGEMHTPYVAEATGSCSASHWLTRSYTVMVGHSPPIAILLESGSSEIDQTAPGRLTRTTGTPVRPSSTITALLVPP